MQSVELATLTVPHRFLQDGQRPIFSATAQFLVPRPQIWETLFLLRLDTRPLKLQWLNKFSIIFLCPIQSAGISESQRMVLLIADNRLTENSSWDERMLGEQLKILSELELDFDLETIGFEGCSESISDKPVIRQLTEEIDPAEWLDECLGLWLLKNSSTEDS